MIDNTIHKQVSEYYGKILKSNDDLKTNACCTSSAPPRYVREILPMIKDEILSRFDIVNIGLHFFLKNVRPYAASCSEA